MLEKNLKTCSTLSLVQTNEATLEQLQQQQQAKANK